MLLLILAAISSLNFVQAHLCWFVANIDCNDHQQVDPNNGRIDRSDISVPEAILIDSEWVMPASRGPSMFHFAENVASMNWLVVGSF